jgi:putative oxidoreductase
VPDHIDHEPRPLFPGLRSFYDIVIPLAWPVIRIAVGWNLLVHGWGKVVRGPSAYIRPFMEQGFDPALPWIWAASAIELLIITALYWKTGFSWLNRGYEYTLLWGLVCFAIALRGGGPYSIDRKIGVEL